MRLIFAALLGGFLWLVFPAQALAGHCAMRADLLRGRDDVYLETPAAMGLSNNGGLVEILLSSEGETWTIIITLPNGVSCLVVAGENWETRPRRLPTSLELSP